MLSTADLVVFPGDLRFLLCFFIECDPSTPGHGSFTSGSPISGTTTACNEQLSVKASTILLRSKVRNPPLSVCDDVLSLQACTYAYVHSLMHSLTLNLDFNKFPGLKRKPLRYYATWSWSASYACRSRRIGWSCYAESNPSSLAADMIHKHRIGIVAVDKALKFIVRDACDICSPKNFARPSLFAFQCLKYPPVPLC